MPVDVAGSVTPEYTSVINVVDDTEALETNVFRNTAVALANRTEYVRQNTPNLRTAVSKILNQEEEFLSVHYNSSIAVLHADGTWKTAAAGSPVITFRDADAADRIGGMRATLGTATSKFALFKGGSSTSAVHRTAQFDRFSAIYHSPTTISDKQVRIGLSQDVNALAGGTHGLAFVHETAEANWQIYSKTSGGTDQVDSGVTVAADADILFELVRASSGTWSVRINESEITTLTDPANKVLTTETFNLGAYFQCDVAASRVFDLLRISGRTTELGDRHA